MSESVRPFSNGTEFMDWTASNCDQCIAQGDPNVSPLESVPHDACVLEAALGIAYCGNGMIGKRAAELIGCDGIWPKPCTVRHHKNDPSKTRAEVLAHITASLDAATPTEKPE